MGILADILSRKRDELPALRQRRLPQPPPPRAVSLARGPSGELRLIAEIKRRSPSAGPLSTALTVGERAGAYARCGAAALSVLCDAPFFDGDYAHLSEARDACDLPILCKEFILDEAQLDAARAYGADLVLLIVRCLTPERLAELAAAAHARALLPLVEIHSEAEAQIACEAGARIIGVNARDLDTLAMDGARAARVLRALPGDVTRVHLSGVASPSDVLEICKGPADAALVGEALMRQDDPEPLLTAFVSAARP
jgi:indole-3-glycerol phosphate synthase